MTAEHAHGIDGGGEVEAWVVTELSVSLWGPLPEGEPHPETTPVGPFASREAADAWAANHVRQFGSGSWSIAPLRMPQTRGGEVAPDVSAPVEPTSKLPAATNTAAADTVLAEARRLCCGENPAAHHAASAKHSELMAFAGDLARAVRGL